MPSFDIVSKVDMQEVDNAINQTIKEIAQRYDFKKSKSEVTLENESIKVLADDDFKLKAVVDILHIPEGASVWQGRVRFRRNGTTDYYRPAGGIQGKGKGNNLGRKRKQAESPGPDTGRSGQGDGEEYRRPSGHYQIAERTGSGH
jgi:hypothetical protein